MTELIACLSSGKGTWGHVSRIIQDLEWEKIILITNQFGKDNFKNEKNADLILIDENMPLTELIALLEKELKNKIKGLEVAVNLISGSGKEHMALLGALIKIGVGIRFVALTADGVKEV